MDTNFLLENPVLLIRTNEDGRLGHSPRNPFKNNFELALFVFVMPVRTPHT